MDHQILLDARSHGLETFLDFLDIFEAVDQEQRQASGLLQIDYCSRPENLLAQLLLAVDFQEKKSKTKHRKIPKKSKILELLNLHPIRFDGPLFFKYFLFSKKHRICGRVMKYIEIWESECLKNDIYHQKMEHYITYQEDVAENLDIPFPPTPRNRRLGF